MIRKILLISVLTLILITPIVLSGAWVDMGYHSSYKTNGSLFAGVSGHFWYYVPDANYNDDAWYMSMTVNATGGVGQYCRIYTGGKTWNVKRDYWNVQTNFCFAGSDAGSTLKVQSKAWWNSYYYAKATVNLSH